MEKHKSKIGFCLLHAIFGKTPQPKYMKTEIMAKVFHSKTLWSENVNKDRTCRFNLHDDPLGSGPLRLLMATMATNAQVVRYFSGNNKFLNPNHHGEHGGRVCSYDSAVAYRRCLM